MENFVPVILLVILCVFGVRWVNNPKTVGNDIVKVVVFVVAVILVAVMLAIPGIVRAETNYVVKYSSEEYTTEQISKNEILVTIPFDGSFLSFVWMTLDEEGNYDPLPRFIIIEITPRKECVNCIPADKLWVKFETPTLTTPRL